MHSTHPDLPLALRRACLLSGTNGRYRCEPEEATWPASMKKLVDHYEQKTQAILQRYGPGPRVHYHTGFVDQPKPMATAATLRAQLVKSQERMLNYASDSWHLRSVEFADVLDVGCGLGGSAIFWAQEFGARVTAITIAPSHIELVTEFARRAGVGSLVMPMLCEASAVPGGERFDAAIAIESSSLFPRRPWFRCLAKVLRSGGRVFISDSFLEGSAYEEPFNRHWCGRIGTIDDYVDAAREYHFRLQAFEDVSDQVATFWATTLALIRAEERENHAEQSRSPTIGESLHVHDVMRRGLLDGGLRHALITFFRE
jgi:tocopherol O-methyltransferase